MVLNSSNYHHESFAGYFPFLNSHAANICSTYMMLTFGIFNPIQIMTCFRTLMTLPNILVLSKGPVKLTRGRESCTESRVLAVSSPVLVRHHSICTSGRKDT